MDALGRLNVQQLNAVCDISRICLVNAQVGSGKTTVLIAKIIYLHEELGIPFDRMVVLTFTNKAANEIRLRLSSALPEADLSETILFGTFHGVARTLMRTVLPVEELGYSSDFAVVNEDEQDLLARRIISQHALNIKYPNKLSSRIEAASAGKWLYGSMKSEDDIRLLMNLLREEKRRMGKMGFDDLIANCTTLLKDVDLNLRWILVDEFQDSDAAQVEMIRAMMGSETRLFAVGDVHQEIYSWRSNGCKAFDVFRSEEGTTLLNLPVNYRSTSGILGLAHLFIEDDSNLVGARTSEGDVRIRAHYNEFHEADYIADVIEDELEKGMTPRDIGVLYRLQKQSKLLEDALLRKGIPFEVARSVSLKDVPVLRWTVRLLTACMRPADEDALSGAFCDENYGPQLDRLSFEMMRSGLFETKAAAELYEKIRSFREWLGHQNDYGSIYEYLGIADYIYPTSVSFAEDKDMVDRLICLADRHRTEDELDIVERFSDYLDFVSLNGVSIADTKEKGERNAVSLMTLHASKGLEFKKVFIIGINLGLLPLYLKNIEEEKRLFFVGITRAIDDLELSYYEKPITPRVTPGKSPFLQQLPEEYAEEVLQSDFGSSGIQVVYGRCGALVEKCEESEGDTGERAGETSASPQAGEEATELFDAAAQNPNTLPYGSYEFGTTPMPTRVRVAVHDRYGEGVVLSEDEMKVVVNFPGYGQKEFIKMFGEVEIVERQADTGEASAFLPCESTVLADSTSNQVPVSSPGAEEEANDEEPAWYSEELSEWRQDDDWGLPDDEDYYAESWRFDCRDEDGPEADVAVKDDVGVSGFAGERERAWTDKMRGDEAMAPAPEAGPSLSRLEGSRHPADSDSCGEEFDKQSQGEPEAKKKPFKKSLFRRLLDLFR